MGGTAQVDAVINKKSFVEVETKILGKEWLLDNHMGIFHASNLAHFLSQPNSTKSNLALLQKMCFWKIWHFAIHPLASGKDGTCKTKDFGSDTPRLEFLWFCSPHSLSSPTLSHQFNLTLFGVPTGPRGLLLRLPPSPHKEPARWVSNPDTSCWEKQPLPPQPHSSEAVNESFWLITCSLSIPEGFWPWKWMAWNGLIVQLWWKIDTHENWTPSLMQTNKLFDHSTRPFLGTTWWVQNWLKICSFWGWLEKFACEWEPQKINDDFHFLLKNIQKQHFLDAVDFSIVHEQKKWGVDNTTALNLQFSFQVSSCIHCQTNDEFNIFNCQTMRSTDVVCVKMGRIAVTHMRLPWCSPSTLTCTVAWVRRDWQSVKLNSISMHVCNHWICIFCDNGLQETANPSVAWQTSEWQLHWPPGGWSSCQFWHFFSSWVELHKLMPSSTKNHLLKSKQKFWAKNGCWTITWAFFMLQIWHTFSPNPTQQNPTLLFSKKCVSGKSGILPSTP